MVQEGVLNWLFVLDFLVAFHRQKVTGHIWKEQRKWERMSIEMAMVREIHAEI